MSPAPFQTSALRNRRQYHHPLVHEKAFGGSVRFRLLFLLLQCPNAQNLFPDAVLDRLMKVVEAAEVEQYLKMDKEWCKDDGYSNFPHDSFVWCFPRQVVKMYNVNKMRSVNRRF